MNHRKYKQKENLKKREVKEKLLKEIQIFQQSEENISKEG